MNRKFIFQFLYFFAFLILFTAAVRADATDDFVRATLAEKHIPGAAIVVIKNGKIVKTAGYGLANVELNVPVTTETVFEIGSVSKQFTAAGIMLLVEDGKISLDQKISAILPNTPESWKDVSVRNLLNHTSGVKSYSSLDGFELYRGLKRDDFIKLLGTQPLDFPTGTQYSYSNSGYSLLGYIIETASGKNYWDFMRERIFQKLGMTKTTDRNPKLIVPNRADGYEWEDGKLVGRDYNLTDLFSAGAIVSTVGDLAKWATALRDDTLLKKDSKLQMWSPLVFNDGKNYPYGFGFRFSDVRDHKLVAHSGQTAGFGANLSRYVDDDLTVIALTNLGANGMGTLIANGVAKIYLPAISLKNLKAQPETNSQIAQTIKRALSERMNDKPTAEIFSPELINSLSTVRTKNENARIASFGTLQKTIFVGEETKDGKTVYRYLAETPKRLFLWRFQLNSDGKISEMTLEEEEQIF